MQQAIVLNDACLGSADYVGCSAVYHGVMTKGLQATEQTLVDLVGELLARRTNANDNMTIVTVRNYLSRAELVISAGASCICVRVPGCKHESTLAFDYKLRLVSADLCIVYLRRRQSRFDDPLWDDIQMLNGYIIEVVYSLIALNAQSPIDSAEANQRTTSLIVGCFISAVVVCNLVYYPRIIGSLNKSIKGSRALLLLLPEDVIGSVKVLKETMMAFTKALNAVQ